MTSFIDSVPVSYKSILNYTNNKDLWPIIYITNYHKFEDLISISPVIPVVVCNSKNLLVTLVIGLYLNANASFQKVKTAPDSSLIQNNSKNNLFQTICFRLVSSYIRYAPLVSHKTTT